MFRKKGIRRTAVVLFWILVWYLLALVVDNSILLVTPMTAFKRLIELMLELSFWKTIFRSLLRIGIGFVLGFSAGLLLAGISLRYPWVEELFKPFIDLMKSVPVVSFVVLFLIWWGSSVLAVAICFLVVMPNIYINTLEGLKNTDVGLLEMAKVFRMPKKNRFFYIYRPGIRPFLESGLKLSLGMCWKSGVAAEVIGTPDFSIGGELYLSKIYLDTAGVLAWTAVIIVLSLCFEKLVLWSIGKFFAWNPSLDRMRAVCEAEENEGMNVISPITVTDLCKAYGEKTVLHELSAVYEQGKVYYLTSPSGSGKTTFLRILCGLERADSGTVQGIERCSMVFQEDRLCEDCNAVQNVWMVTGNVNSALSGLRRVLSEDALYKPCSQLSGGMKRRVALVRAMEAKSQVVILDEPFTGMDAETKKAVEDYIKLRRRGRTLIIATHIKGNAD